MPALKPEDFKVHLAVNSGYFDPMDEFLGGRFEDWQSLQNQANFERPYIISMIQLPEADTWLFAGGFEVMGKADAPKKDRHKYIYQTQPLIQLDELEGRLLIRYHRKGRASYRLGENIQPDLFVHAILPKKRVIEDFPGYSKVMISKSHLNTVIQQNVTSWRVALSSVAGVYLITDTKTGNLYVGSATGEGGFWQRWSDYSANGHGGNLELKKLLKINGQDYALGFQYSILELASTHTLACDVIEREQHWKRVLCSQEFGMNRN